MLCGEAECGLSILKGLLDSSRLQCSHLYNGYNPTALLGKLNGITQGKCLELVNFSGQMGGYYTKNHVTPNICLALLPH